ncbi:YojF family protein [Ectobacillus ponti]|uniref:YojF family protein n=1 Tax=Ectobacillus ponti TaxID=2961894 RepID=A0AA41X9C5_9BACI|nr:YojF family protein [Ectobacillus ponti]
MERIQNIADVQRVFDSFAGPDVYVHLETTNGAYAAHRNEQTMTVGAFIRNARISFERGTLAGKGPYRAGLKMEHGWVYAEGLTHWLLNEKGQLLLSGHDDQGRLAVALQLSRTPF